MIINQIKSNQIKPDQIFNLQIHKSNFLLFHINNLLYWYHSQYLIWLILILPFLLYEINLPYITDFPPSHFFFFIFPRLISFFLSFLFFFSFFNNFFKGGIGVYLAQQQAATMMGATSLPVTADVATALTTITTTIASFLPWKWSAIFIWFSVIHVEIIEFGWFDLFSFYLTWFIERIDNRIS